MNDCPNQTGAYVEELLSSPDMASQIVFHRFFQSAPPEFGSLRQPFSVPVSKLLEQKNLNLYIHQAEAINHIRAGHSVVVATPTASGKSLIYNLPVLDSFIKDPDGRALYLFPLKALAQDQLQAFNRMCSCWPKDVSPLAMLYDGDTSAYMRRKIRTNPPAALITNPEMLHLGILPWHQNWSTFLSNLNYVIVDEAHTYRGVFGTHMAQVFRRLNRITGIYGVQPTYIFCTATLGNPQELTSNLLGREEAPVLINKSGAPQGPRHFIFVNPDLAPSTCAIQLLKKALAKNLRAIVYCQSRRLTELISLWAATDAGEHAQKISSYRAGFLPEERRDIEAKMANGDLLAVVTTSALELGIDIGGLDVCILVGYPGTIMQTLQRGGRVGRTRQESAVILVAGEDALDQYFARHPEDFFSRKPEKAVINPANEVIMAAHLECAAQEYPLENSEPWLQAKGANAALRTLQNKGLLYQDKNGERWHSTRKHPQRDVDLRGSGGTYSIENQSGEIIGMMDSGRVWKEAHPGAVYLHKGMSWLIEEIEEGTRRILAKPGKVNWFTRTRGRKETIILQEYERQSLGRCAIFYGRLQIIEHITGYEKRQASGNRLIGITPLAAPAQIMETEGIWIVIPDNIRMALEEQFINFMGSIHALEHAAIGMAPLEIMADRNDFGGISIPLHYQLGLPAVFLYDGLPGGAGLAACAFSSMRRILESVLTVVSECACEEGCPSCIHSPKCGSGNRPLSKQGCITLLKELLLQGDEGDAICATLQIGAPVARKPVPSLHLEHAVPVLDESQVITPDNYVVFDVETRLSASEVGGWNNAREMGVSVAVLYESASGKYYVYEQDNLEEMFKKMIKASLIVGFNNSRFDYQVLAPFAEKIHGIPLLDTLPTLDLLQKIKEKLNYRVSLENLGSATLNSSKTGSGLQALRWWKEGKRKEIAEYCKKDVELTRNLYLFGLQEKYLLFSNRCGQKVRVEVDFTNYAPRKK